MLGKLLKYDLKFIYKNLVVFYTIAIISAVLVRIFGAIEDSIMFDILQSVASGFAISFMCSSIINTLMRAWVRFSMNIYGDESYLTHTLPVEKTTIYTSKFLSSIITMFTSVGVILLAVFIGYYSKENLQFVKNSLDVLADSYDSSVMGILLVVVFVFFLQMATMTQAGYTGLLLGHRFDNKKTVLSVVWGFVCYFAAQSISLLVLFVIALFNKDFMNLFFTNEVPNLGMFKFIMYIAIAIYAVMLVAYYLIDLAIFKKGVNVD